MKKKIVEGDIWESRSDARRFLVASVRNYGRGIQTIDVVSVDKSKPGEVNNRTFIRNKDFRNEFFFVQTASTFVEAQRKARVLKEREDAATAARQAEEANRRAAFRANVETLQRDYYAEQIENKARRIREAEEAKERIAARYSKALYTDFYFGRDKFKPATLFDVNTLYPFSYADTDSIKTKENTMTEIKVGQIWESRRYDAMSYTVTKMHENGTITVVYNFSGKEVTVDKGEIDYVFNDLKSALVLRTERPLLNIKPGDKFRMMRANKHRVLTVERDHKCSTCSGLYMLSRGGVEFDKWKEGDEIQRLVDRGVWQVMSTTQAEEAAPEEAYPCEDIWVKPEEFQSLTLNAYNWNGNAHVPKRTSLKIIGTPVIGDMGQLTFTQHDGVTNTIADGHWIEYTTH